MIFSLVKLGHEAVTFPFRCEEPAWDNWQCASDSLVAIPGKAFEAFRGTCLFKTSCFALTNAARRGAAYTTGAPLSAARASSTLGSNLVLGEGFDLNGEDRFNFKW